MTGFPCGSAQPNASNVNYGPGHKVANAVVAKISDNGTVWLYTLVTAHLSVDVNGYF